MSRKMRIEIRQLPPVEYSPNWRGHWSQRQGAGKLYQQAIFYECVNYRNKAMKKLNGWYPFEKAILNLTFIFKDRRERDENNLRARFKPGQDALVQAGFIKGDSPQYLVMGGITIEVDPLRAPLTVIDLEEAYE